MPDWTINPLNPATTAECELCEELILSSYKKCRGTRGAPLMQPPASADLTCARREDDGMSDEMWDKLHDQVQKWRDRAALPGSRLTATEALSDVLRLMDNLSRDQSLTG